MHPAKSLLFLRICFASSAILAIILLFTPIIWMEIGPLGKAYYGPTVPDIYIYGGAITGKDLNWEPILVAMIFQLVVILIGIFLAITSFQWIGKNNARALTCHTLNTLLLVLFPLWISMYSGHVINNSDGAAADLTVHYGQGVRVYTALLTLNIAVYVKLIVARQNPRRSHIVEN